MRRLPHRQKVKGRNPPSKTLVAGGLLAGKFAASAILTRYQTREAERRYPPAGNFVTVDGLRLHYRDTGGEGPPLVLFHGIGAMIADMEISGLLTRAAERYRVIVFDRPGYGYSERPGAWRWTPQAQAALFRKALDQLGVERPTVLGHSWGTMVALALALDHPSAVSGLVLLSGYYFPSDRLDARLLSLPARGRLGALMRHSVTPLAVRALMPEILRRTFAPQKPPPRFKAEFPTGLVLRPSQLQAEAEESGMADPGAAALQHRYGGLRLPVSILAGSEDQIVTTDEQSLRLQAEIPGSRLKLLPGLGHMIHYFETAEVLAAVDEIASRRAE